MKTKLFITFSTIIFCIQFAHAQTDTTSSGNNKYPSLKTYPHNNVQMNVTSLILFKNYNFSYERLLSKKISVVASYRFMPSAGLKDVPVGKKIFEKITTDDDRIQQTTASNQALTAEVRFYGGKHSGARGFYFSLYGRYANFKSEYPYEYESESTKLYSFPLNTKAQGVAGGIMMGAQWLIAKRVIIDWYVLGAHYGSLNGTINGVADLSDLSQEEKQNIQDDINGSVELLSKQYINATVDDKGVHGKVHGPFIGLRGGISIGIAF